MPNLNVKLSKDIFESLQELKLATHAETWVDFLQTIASGEVDIAIEFLSINDDDPKKYVVDLKLGDFHYLWKDGKFTLVSSPITPWRRRRALKALKAMGGIGQSPK